MTPLDCVTTALVSVACDMAVTALADLPLSLNFPTYAGHSHASQPPPPPPSPEALPLPIAPRQCSHHCRRLNAPVCCACLQFARVLSPRASGEGGARADFPAPAGVIGGFVCLQPQSAGSGTGDSASSTHTATARRRDDDLRPGLWSRDGGDGVRRRVQVQGRET